MTIRYKTIRQFAAESGYTEEAIRYLGPRMSAFLSALKIPAHLKIPLAFVRVLEHNTVMDSRLARIELKE